MKRQTKLVFALILIAAISMLTVLSCSAFTNNEREGMVEWTITDGILSDGIYQYKPYTSNDGMVDFSKLGYNIMGNVYWYNTRVTANDGRRYDVCAPYDFAPVVFLEATYAKDGEWPIYAYYRDDNSDALASLVSGSYEKIRAITSGENGNRAFDISDELMTRITGRKFCEEKTVSTAVIREAVMYEIFGFDSFDFLGRYESFLFQNGDEWCYVNPARLSTNNFYADGTLALDKDMDITVTVLKSDTLELLLDEMEDEYDYETTVEFEEYDDSYESLFSSLVTEETAKAVLTTIVIILGIALPLGLGVYSAIDIFVRKRGKNNIASLVMAGAEAVWLISGIIFLIIISI